MHVLTGVCIIMCRSCVLFSSWNFYFIGNNKISVSYIHTVHYCCIYDYDVVILKTSKKLYIEIEASKYSMPFSSSAG